MNRFSKISFVLLLSVAIYSPISVNGAANTHGTFISFSLFRCSDGGIHSKPETPPNRHRANRLPLHGTISAEGVSIPGVDASEILSFEIYTPEGFCMGAFVDETDFIESLFSLSGEYEVRFTTEEAVYVGFVEI